MRISAFPILFVICFVLASCSTANRQLFHSVRNPVQAVAGQSARLVEKVSFAGPVALLKSENTQLVRPNLSGSRAGAFLGLQKVKMPGKAEKMKKPAPLRIGQAEVAQPASVAIQAQPLTPLMEPRILNRMAIAGLACGVLAFLPFVSGLSLLLAIPFALAGGMFSLIALRQFRDRGIMYRGQALAKAGLAISVVVLGLLTVMGAAVLIAV